MTRVVRRLLRLKSGLLLNPLIDGAPMQSATIVRIFMVVERDVVQCSDDGDVEEEGLDYLPTHSHATYSCSPFRERLQSFLFRFLKWCGMGSLARCHLPIQPTASNDGKKRLYWLLHSHIISFAVLQGGGC